MLRGNEGKAILKSRDVTLRLFVSESILHGIRIVSRHLKRSKDERLDQWMERSPRQCNVLKVVSVMPTTWAVLPSLPGPQTHADADPGRSLVLPGPHDEADKRAMTNALASNSGVDRFDALGRRPRTALYSLHARRL